MGNDEKRRKESRTVYFFWVYRRSKIRKIKFLFWLVTNTKAGKNKKNSILVSLNNLGVFRYSNSAPKSTILFSWEKFLISGNIFGDLSEILGIILIQLMFFHVENFEKTYWKIFYFPIIPWKDLCKWTFLICLIFKLQKLKLFKINFY